MQVTFSKKTPKHKRYGFVHFLGKHQHKISLILRIIAENGSEEKNGNAGYGLWKCYPLTGRTKGYPITQNSFLLLYFSQNRGK